MENEDLKRKYKGEKSLRKGCEKWLRAELKGREEYDTLLRAIRETAAMPVGGGGGGRLGAIPPALALIPGGDGVSDVELLLEKMKHSEGIRDSPPLPIRGGNGASSFQDDRKVTTMSLLSESDAQRRELSENNKQLKAELLAAKRLLHETRR